MLDNVQIANVTFNEVVNTLLRNCCLRRLYFVQIVYVKLAILLQIFCNDYLYALGFRPINDTGECEGYSIELFFERDWRKALVLETSDKDERCAAEIMLNACKSSYIDLLALFNWCNKFLAASTLNLIATHASTISVNLLALGGRLLPPNLPSGLFVKMVRSFEEVKELIPPNGGTQEELELMQAYCETARIRMRPRHATPIPSFLFGS